MAATAQIVIVVDDSGATKALQRVNAEAGKLAPTLQPVQRISEQTFNNIEGGALKARESAALLGEEFGVHIPRALRGTIAQMSLIGPAMTAAFSGLAVIGFAKIAIDMIDGVINHIRQMDPEENLANRLMGLDAVNRERFHAAIKEQEQLAVQTKLATANESERIEVQLAEDVRKINEQLESAKATFGVKAAEKLEQSILARKQLAAAQQLALARKNAVEIGTAEDAAGVSRARGLAQIEAEMNAQVRRIELEKKAGLNAQVAEAKITAARAEGARKAEDFNTQIVERQRALSAEGNRALLQAEASTSAGRERIDKEYEVRLNEITMREVQETLALKKQGITQEVVLDKERLAAKIENENKIRDLARQRAEEEIQINTEAAIAMLPPWQRADAQIVADAQARIRKIEEMEAKDKNFFLQGEREKAAIMQKEWHDRVENMANQLEGLYNEITTGGLKQFFINRFKHMVFEMVAAWIIGMQQMRAASQQQMGSGGGILGAIFGGIFGGGGGGGGLGGIFGGGASGGPGGTPPFVGSFAGGSGDAGMGSTGGLFGSLGLGLSAGMGGGPGATLPSGAGPGGIMGGGPLGGLLGKLGPLGSVLGGLLSPAGIGGIGLLASSFGKGGILAGLAGAAGGGLTTFAALSPLLAAGPLGWIAVGIGTLLGFLGGFLQHSTKKARLAIEADIKQKSATIEDAYNLFQMDWMSSRDALEQLRQAGVDALKQAGVKDISRSRVGHVDQWIDKAEKEIDLTQAERNRRAALTFGPAQFRMGGFVGPGLGGPAPAWFAGTAMHFASGGAVPAMLHEGEYVMRPEAVARWGRGRFDRMNSGGGGGDTHLHVQINAVDAPSFESFLNRGGGVKILKFFSRAQREGMW